METIDTKNQPSREARVFVDYAVTDDCSNPESYGELCVKCNQCGRFAPKTEETTN